MATFCGTTGARPGTAPDLGTLGCCSGEGDLLGDQLPRPSATRLLAIPFLTSVFPYLSCCFFSHCLFHCLSRCLSSFLRRSLPASLFCPSLVSAGLHLPRRYWVGQLPLRVGSLVRRISGLARWTLLAFCLKSRTRKSVTLWWGLGV